MIRDTYRTVILLQDLVEAGGHAAAQAIVDREVAQLRRRSGAVNVPTSAVVAQLQILPRALVFDVTFDASAWTGLPKIDAAVQPQEGKE